MPELKDKNVFLIGFMGVGKSVVAPRLAEKMGVPLIDMGPLIRQKLGYRSSSQIFADLGEKAYRDAETEILKEKLKLKGQVFSCGGGITVREENVKMMKGKGTVVWMTATPETILEHLEGDDSRPLLRGRKSPEAIAEFMEERRPMYEKAADVQVAVDGLDVDEVVDAILKVL